MMFHLTNIFDVVLLTIITIVAFDALRQLHPLVHPARAICFLLIAIGAFGWIMVDMRDTAVPWWALMLHAGFALHSVIRFIARNSMEGFTYVDAHLHDRGLVLKPDRRKAKR